MGSKTLTIFGHWDPLGKLLVANARSPGNDAEAVLRGRQEPERRLFRSEARLLFYLLDSEWGNFKVFGLQNLLYLRKFELFGARLLKKRDFTGLS